MTPPVVQAAAHVQPRHRTRGPCPALTAPVWTRGPHSRRPCPHGPAGSRGGGLTAHRPARHCIGRRPCVSPSSWGARLPHRAPGDTHGERRGSRGLALSALRPGASTVGTSVCQGRRRLPPARRTLPSVPRVTTAGPAPDPRRAPRPGWSLLPAAEVWAQRFPRGRAPFADTWPDDRWALQAAGPGHRPGALAEPAGRPSPAGTGLDGKRNPFPLQLPPQARPRQPRHPTRVGTLAHGAGGRLARADWWG